MRAIATIIDGELFSPEGVRLSPERESRAVAVAAPVPQPQPQRPQRQTAEVVALDPLDEVAELLARIIKIATQQLRPGDQRRARELVHAASSALSASTVLDPSDQRRLNNALRNSK